MSSSPPAASRSSSRRTLHSLAACAKPAEYRGVIVVENGPPCRPWTGSWRSFRRGTASRYLLQRAAEQEPGAEPRPGRAAASRWSSSPTTTCCCRARRSSAYARARGGPVRRRVLRWPDSCPITKREPPPAWLVPLLPRSAAGWRMPVDRASTEIAQPEFIGPNFAAFASDILRAGGFDTRLGPGSHMASPGEDTEIQARLLAPRRSRLLLARSCDAASRPGQLVLGGRSPCTAPSGTAFTGASPRPAGRDSFPAAWLKLSGQWLNDLLRIRRWRRSQPTSRSACGPSAWPRRWHGRWQGIQLGWNWDAAGPAVAARVASDSPPGR